MVTISASVGHGGFNRKTDVLVIQQALNKVPTGKGGPLPKLKVDGIFGSKTMLAIINFQKTNKHLVQDGRIDAHGATLTYLNSLLSPAAPTPNFTDKNLFGPGGPSANDIRQDALGDCYFVATLGAVALQNPAQIKGAIHYDPAKQQFRVRLYDLKGAGKFFWVTQTELQNNVAIKGGSYVDNTGKYDRTWPAVIETAYAKMFDTNPADGLGEGYSKIANGGWPSDAMMAVTGNVGTKLSYVYYSKLGTAGSVALLGSRLSTALKLHKSVSLWAVPEKDSRSFWERLTGSPIPQDGLVDNHVYTVMSATKAGTDWNVNVRNPWGTNMGVGEGRDTASATITVSLKTLVETGGLESFQISK